MNLPKLLCNHVSLAVVFSMNRGPRATQAQTFVILERLKMARSLACIMSFIWMLYGSSLFLAHSVHMVSIRTRLTSCCCYSIVFTYANLWRPLLLSLFFNHRNAAIICKMAVDPWISAQNFISKNSYMVGLVRNIKSITWPMFHFNNPPCQQNHIPRKIPTHNNSYYPSSHGHGLRRAAVNQTQARLDE